MYPDFKKFTLMVSGETTTSDRVLINTNCLSIAPLKLKEANASIENKIVGVAIYL